MTITCLHCGAETSNGLALCDLCRRFGEDIFEMLPVYIRNLSRQRRPGRPNGSLGTSGSWIIQRGETEGSKVRVALERVANDLDTWARVLSDDRNITPADGDTEAETIVALCEFLGTNLTSIATLEWAGQFLRDMARHERRLRALTETVVPGWYAGKCQRITGRDMEGNVYTCGADTFVVPGLTWVTCNGVIGHDADGEELRCGATTYARDHLEIILAEARDWIAPPMRIAEAIVALLDTEMSTPRLHKRIVKWGDRARVAVVRRRDVDGDEIGPRRYRFGEVLDRLLLEGATRISDAVESAC